MLYVVSRWLLGLLLVLSGHVYAFDSPIRSIDLHSNGTATWEEQLRTGQLLIVESPDPLQLFTMLGYEKFSPFVHIGIVEVGADGIYVYDTTSTVGKFYLEGKSPSDTMKGSVRRLSLQSFMDYARTINIFSTPRSVNPDKLIAFAKKHWLAKTPFDAYFNLNEQSRLYCSELIALALKYAGGRYSTAAMRFNPSLQAMRDWMKITGPRFVFPYNLVEPRNWVGTVSLDQSNEEILATRLVKYELYRRFTKDQKIGNILTTSGASAAVREPVKRFDSRVHRFFSDKKVEQQNLEQWVAHVRRIADETLGAANNVPEQPLPRCQLSLRACATKQ